MLLSPGAEPSSPPDEDVGPPTVILPLPMDPMEPMEPMALLVVVVLMPPREPGRPEPTALEAAA